MSWDEKEPHSELYVRIWKDDPRRDDYFNIEWPDSWALYETDTKGAAETMNHAFDWQPNEPCYGFIGDDIVLRTKNGLKKLEQEAWRWFVAYPNDTLQRHRLMTHFCMGGELARFLGYIVPRQFKHHYMDVVVQNIVMNAGMLRYVPQVIFQHKHFLINAAERDDTYKVVYGESGTEPVDPEYRKAQALLQAFGEKELPRVVGRLRQKMMQLFERPDLWEAEDVARGLVQDSA